MAIRKLARMGNPVLRLKARELSPKEIRSPEVSRILKDMFDTLEDEEGIGLAAPQIHESIALAIVHYPSDSEPRVLFNPKITVLEETEQAYWEGCLSIPEIRGLVYRPRKIRVDYVSLDCKPVSIEVEGFPATVFQHELDHLFGVLFIDRVRFIPGDSPISFTEEYARHHLPDPDSGIGELDD